MSDPNILQLLGKIDGKLDQALEAAKEHREDDKRRFTEVYGQLQKHDQDISFTKGATKIIAWLLGGGALAIATLVYAMANGGLHK